jgi:hypothetical protein
MKFQVRVTMPAGSYRRPAFFWFYPNEYVDQAAYNRTLRERNPNLFSQISGGNKAILLRAGYDPDALARSLQTLENVSASAQGLGGWYSTHPTPKKRREELEEETSKSATASVGLKTRTARFQSGVSSLR